MSEATEETVARVAAAGVCVTRGTRRPSERRGPNGVRLPESQLELNCESGRTLYIKKETKRKKKQTISLRLLLLFSPSVLIYGLVGESDWLQVFYFFGWCKLPGKKENRQKKP